MASKHFHQLLDKMREIHNKKNHDYSKDSDPFSNFEISAELVKHYNNPIDQVFVGIISIKLARLSELLNGKEAKNESIKDTFIDLANYCALWGAYYSSKEEINWGTVPEHLRPEQETIDLMKSKINEVLEQQCYIDPQIQTLPIPMELGIELPNKCSSCRTTNSWERIIEHAVICHAAKWDTKLKTLKYPSGEFYLFPPNYNLGKFNSL